MGRLLQRILKGYHRRPFAAVVYAFLLYGVIAVGLALLSPYLHDSTPGEMTPSEDFYGITLTVAVALFALLFSGWFVSDK